MRWFNPIDPLDKNPKATLDFREDEKKKKKKRENKGGKKFLSMFGWEYLIFMGGKLVGFGYFLFGPPKCFLPKLGRKLKRKPDIKIRTKKSFAISFFVFFKVICFSLFVFVNIVFFFILFLFLLFVCWIKQKLFFFFWFVSVNVLSNKTVGFLFLFF